MEITFGIPNQRMKTAKVNPFPGKAIITMEPRPKMRGSYKFEFNKQALDALRLTLTGDEQIALGFKPEAKRVFIANVTGSTFDKGYRVAKQGTFSNIKAFNYLEKLLDLNTENPNYFELVESTDVSNAFELVLRTPAVEADEDQEETAITEDSSSVHVDAR